ncbi:MAG: hypothetical protein ACKOOI_15145, partial [Pirellula sp.]
GIARGQTINHDRRHSNVSFTEKQQSNDSDFRWSGQPRGEKLLSLRVLVYAIGQFAVNTA